MTWLTCKDYMCHSWPWMLSVCHHLTFSSLMTYHRFPTRVKIYNIYIIPVMIVWIICCHTLFYSLKIWERGEALQQFASTDVISFRNPWSFDWFVLTVEVHNFPTSKEILVFKLRSSLRQSLDLDHDLVDIYEISESQLTMDVFHLS